ISLTVFSVFDMLMMMLLYFSLKVAEVSLSKSSHLVPSWLTGYILLPDPIPWAGIEANHRETASYRDITSSAIKAV
ncbi:hypothetical protein, partial [Candidatus Seongchinamella marina]|uniref:hypothetical protein n=1 Tax=Candidatus Seongchinamella marina TaxID=2518990 RepID=UPI00242B8D9C